MYVWVLCIDMGGLGVEKRRRSVVVCRGGAVSMGGTKNASMIALTADRV